MVSTLPGRFSEKGSAHVKTEQPHEHSHLNHLFSLSHACPASKDIPNLVVLSPSHFFFFASRCLFSQQARTDGSEAEGRNGLTFRFSTGQWSLAAAALTTSTTPAAPCAAAQIGRFDDSEDIIRRARGCRDGHYDAGESRTRFAEKGLLWIYESRFEKQRSIKGFRRYVLVFVEFGWISREIKHQCCYW